MPPGSHLGSRAALRRAAVAALPVLLIAALLAAACTRDEVLPGAAPYGHTVLDHLPANSPGWLQASTDPSSESWRRLARAAGGGAGADDAQILLTRAVAVSLATSDDELSWAEDVSPWIGPDFGLALTTGDVEAPEAIIAWAQVDDPDALASMLRRRGWRVASADATVDEIRPWLPPADATGVLPWLGVGDGLLLAAGDGDSLSAIVEAAADRSARQEVQSLGEFVDTAELEPVSVFVRGLTLRQTISTRVGGNAAALQVARVMAGVAWITAGKGAMFEVTGVDDRVRIDGHVLYRGLELGQRLLDPVDRDLLGALPASTAVVGAIEDPGVLLDGIVKTAQRGGSEFTTELDHPGGEDSVRLEDVFDVLDGDAAFGVLGTGDDAGPGIMQVLVEDNPNEVEQDEDEPTGDRPSGGDSTDGVPAPVLESLEEAVSTIVDSFDLDSVVRSTPGGNDRPALTTIDVLRPPTNQLVLRPRVPHSPPQPLVEGQHFLDASTASTSSNAALAATPAWKTAWARLDVPDDPVGLAWISSDAWAACGGPIPDLSMPWFGSTVDVSGRLAAPIAVWMSWSDEDGELSLATELDLGPGEPCGASTPPVPDQDG